VNGFGLKSHRNGGVFLILSSKYMDVLSIKNRFPSVNTILFKHVYSHTFAYTQSLNKELGIAAIAFKSQEGTVVTDANTVILRVNNAFTNITCYSVEEAIGQKPKLLSSSGRQDSAFYETMWDSINKHCSGMRLILHDSS
jgi:PAS domain-containing protein